MCLAQASCDWLRAQPSFRVSDFSTSRGRAEEVHGPQKASCQSLSTVHLPASCNMIRTRLSYQCGCHSMQLMQSDTSVKTKCKQCRFTGKLGRGSKDNLNERTQIYLVFYFWHCMCIQHSYSKGLELVLPLRRVPKDLPFLKVEETRPSKAFSVKHAFKQPTFSLTVGGAGIEQQDLNTLSLHLYILHYITLYIFCDTYVSDVSL